MNTTETRFDTLHHSILQKWGGMSINELVEEKELLIKKINLLTPESHGIRHELMRVLTHLEKYIDTKIENEL